MATKEEKSIVPVLNKEALPMIKQAVNLTIDDPKSMGEAATMLTDLNKFHDKVVAYKESKTKPLNALLKTIRAETKELEEALEQGIATIRGKMSKYQTKEKQMADAKITKIADRTGEGRGHLTPETAAKKIGEVQAPASNVIAEGGSVEFRTVKKLTITNGLAVKNYYFTNNMLDYLTIDEKLLIDLLKTGVKVDGAQIDESQVPYNKR